VAHFHYVLSLGAVFSIFAVGAGLISVIAAEYSGRTQNEFAANRLPVTLVSSMDSDVPSHDPALTELENSKIKAFRVFPESVLLDSKTSTQNLVAQVELTNGLTVDVTGQVQLKTIKVGSQKDNTQKELILISGAKIGALADGKTAVQATYGKHHLTIPVEVKNSAMVRPTSFQQDVIPVLTKTGCNKGSCHGAARGKDGFLLSLFGFDPKKDHFRLVHEIPGRRIDLAIPESSLLLEKGTASVSHSGGGPIKVNDPNYEVLRSWVKSGAPYDKGKVTAVTKVEIYPPHAVLNGTGAGQQLTVLATYEDGRKRDVTSLAIFSSSDDNAASVSPAGKIVAKNRGESFVMARFDTHTVGSPVIVLPKDLKFSFQAPKEVNYIDQLMYKKWNRLRINPSKLCDDRTFIRRVYLDICGTLPTAAEVTAFVQDKDLAKRSKLVDRLLERKEFVELWVMKWAELLQIRSTQTVSYKSALLYFNWLQQQVANDVPVNKMFEDLLTSSGGTFSAPSTNYFQNETDTLKVSENVAQVFLGMRIQCAQCHNHPFDRWTMDDYYSFSAFFSQIGRKRGQDPRETVVFNRGRGDVRHLVGNRVMKPKFLGGDVPKLKPGQDRRSVMAGWLTDKQNPYFSRNLCNIVWAHFFGRGIVHPVDDVRVSNPSVNDELLSAMAEKLASNNFNFKTLVRDICNSNTYQLDTQANQTNATDRTNFSRRYLTRVRSEVLLDAISQVTETKNKFQGLPLGARAVQIADGNTSNYFLTTFGRAKRETVCSCEVVTEPNLSQALHLINGTTVNNKCRQGGVVSRLLKEGKSVSEVIQNLYERCLARKPTEQELKSLTAKVSQYKDKKRGLEDVFWAVLNSREFLFNH